eukprot:XP_001611985.1 hypothetical protein [Babesia bovis T2Bo]
MSLYSNRELLLCANRSCFSVVNISTDLYNNRDLRRGNELRTQCSCGGLRNSWTSPSPCDTVFTKTFNYRTHCNDAIWYPGANHKFISVGDTLINVWDLEKGVIDYTASVNVSTVKKVAVCRGSGKENVIVVGLSCGSISSCDLRTPVAFNYPNMAGRGEITSISCQYHNDNTVICGYDDNNVCVWDLRRYNHPLARLGSKGALTPPSVIHGCHVSDGRKGRKHLTEIPATHSQEFDQVDDIWSYLMKAGGKPTDKSLVKKERDPIAVKVEPKFETESILALTSFPTKPKSGKSSISITDLLLPPKVRRGNTTTGRSVSAGSSVGKIRKNKPRETQSQPETPGGLYSISDLPPSTRKEYSQPDSESGYSSMLLSDDLDIPCTPPSPRKLKGKKGTPPIHHHEQTRSVTSHSSQSVRPSRSSISPSVNRATPKTSSFQSYSPFSFANLGSINSSRESDDSRRRSASLDSDSWSRYCSALELDHRCRTNSYTPTEYSHSQPSSQSESSGLIDNIMDARHGDGTTADSFCRSAATKTLDGTLAQQRLQNTHSPMSFRPIGTNSVRGSARNITGDGDTTPLHGIEGSHGNISPKSSRTPIPSNRKRARESLLPIDNVKPDTETSKNVVKSPITKLGSTASTKNVNVCSHGIATDIKSTCDGKSLFVGRQKGYIEYYDARNYRLIDYYNISALCQPFETKSLSYSQRLRLVCRDGGNWVMFNMKNKVGVLDTRKGSVNCLVPLRWIDHELLVDEAYIPSHSRKSQDASYVTALTAYPGRREVYALNEYGELFIIHPDNNSLFGNMNRDDDNTMALGIVDML